MDFHFLTAKSDVLFSDPVVFHIEMVLSPISFLIYHHVIAPIYPKYPGLKPHLH